MRTAKFSYAKAIGTRLLAGIPVFLVVTFAATALSNLTPGSAAQLILGENASPEQVAKLNAQYGYDLPVIERYLMWLGALLSGDLGQTIYSKQPVAGMLLDRASVTFEIAFLAMFVSLAIGVPLAMFTASRPGGTSDMVLRGRHLGDAVGTDIRDCRPTRFRFRDRAALAARDWLGFVQRGPARQSLLRGPTGDVSERPPDRLLLPRQPQRVRGGATGGLHPRRPRQGPVDGVYPAAPRPAAGLAAGSDRHGPVDDLPAWRLLHCRELLRCAGNWLDRVRGGQHS